jgi:Ca2+-binding RTX toxin-like protein
MAIIIPFWRFVITIGDNEDSVISGSNGRNIIFARNGHDTVYAAGGNDLVFGGRGNDKVYGGSGSDVLLGGWGNDALYGDSGNDILFGGFGADFIQGGAGSDMIFLQGGNDTASYVIDDNIGARDIYHGGFGFDTLVIDVSQAQLNSFGFTADDMKQYFANNNSAGVVDFSSLGFNLVASKFEAIEVNVIGGNNEAPTIQLENTITNLAENIDTSGRIKVADIVIIDDGVGNNNLSLGGADADLFEIDGNQLFLKAGSEIDFESNPQLDVSVLVDDPSLGNVPDDMAALSIAVTDVNEAPVGVDDVLSTNEDTPLTISTLSLIDNDTDVDGNDLLFSSIIEGPTYGALVDNEDGTLTYTPNADFNGSDSFTYEVSDGNGGLSTATVVINVSAVNDAPVGVDDTLSTNEDTPLTISTLSLIDNDTDVDGNDLLFSSIIEGPTYGALVDNEDGTLTYTPNADFNGSDSFTYEVSDGNGGLSTATVVINVSAVNDAPVGVDDTLSTNEDTPLTISTLSLIDNDTDVDGNDLLFSSIIEGPTYGALVDNEDGTLTYTPNADFNGSDSFTYEVSDGNGGLSTATVVINVSAVNDAPVGVDDALSTNEDTPLLISTLSLVNNDTDADGDDLSFSAIAQGPAHGVLVDNEDGTLTYTPNADFNGSDSFTYEVSDGNRGLSTATVVINVSAVNDAPEGVDDALSVDEDTPLLISTSSLVSNDTDVDGDDLSFSAIVAGPTHGALVDNEDGTLTYTPNADFNGSDGFTYEVSDGNGGVSSATVYIEVTPVNDAPTVSLSETVASLSEDTDTSARIKVANIDIADDTQGVNALSLSGADASLFEIDGTELYLVAGADLDFESNPQLDVVVSVDDIEVGLSPDDSVTLSISVTDVNETPTDLSLSGDIVNEHASDGSLIGIVTSTDPDANDTALYTLIDDAAGRFAIDAVSGELTVADGTLLNYEVNSSHDITVRVTDGANNSYDETFTVTLRDLTDSVELAGLSGSDGFVIINTNSDDYAVQTVSNAGDVNGDGFDDLLLGTSVSSSSLSVSYIVFGGDALPDSVNLSDLNGVDGFVINGISSNDLAGGSVSNAGDVNGDGFDDLIIGAYGADPNGNVNAGVSYVVFGGETLPASISLHRLAIDNSGFVINGIDANDGSGYSVSNAGDVNGDGFDDLIVGALYGDPNGDVDAGESYVVFGGETLPASLNLADLNGVNGFVINGVDAGDYSGISVSNAGDVNGDGFDDLIIGAIYADPNGNVDAGESYVVFGGETLPASVNLADLNGANGFVINGINDDDRSRSVSNAGDVNGDGFDDLIISATYADPNGNVDAGESYVVFGDSILPAAIDLSSLNGDNGFVINGIDADDRSGYSVSNAGDVNGDGFDDLIISATYADPNGNVDAGESYVLFGGEALPASVNLADLNGANGFVINGVDAYDRSGQSVSGAGDLNGDGFDDLVIVALTADPNSSWAPGESYVIYGRDYRYEANLIGDATNEMLVGSTADDTLIGGQGDDTLVSNGGRDTLIGGEGNDTIVFADDTFLSIDGGTGIDTLLVTGGASLVLVDSQDADNDGNVIEPGPAALRIEDVERIMFDDNNHSLTMPTGSSSIREIDGGALTASSVLVVDAGEYRAGLTVTGGAGNDIITGGFAHDVINAGAGDDTIAGGAGNDTLNGGAGNDTVVYSGDSLGYSITTISANQFQVTDTNLADGDDGTDLLTDIEILQFSDVGVTMPIVLDLANDGVSFISLADSQVMYDVDGDGQLESTAWVGADDALLAYDANLDGSVSGRGEISFVDYVADADTDLEGLRYFDSNADGLLDASDAQFDQFYVWQDANSNGVSEQGELMTLTEAGIASIALTSDGVTYAQQDVFVYGMGEYTLTDGSKGQFADSGFVYQDQKDVDLTQLAALSADEDSFVFAPSSGAVTLSDFDAVDGSQKIDLSILDTDFATLLANDAISQVDADAVINLSGVGAESGDQITLQGVHVADLDASDFVF